MPPAVALLNYVTIRELYHTFADFFPYSDLYIINFAGRISKTAMGWPGGAQRLVFRVKGPKKRVRAAHATQKPARKEKVSLNTVN